MFKAGDILDGLKWLKKLRKTCKTHSFVTGTDVLLADGSTKNIEDVQAGDKVVTTDPATGKTTTRKVKATITTKDDKNFVNIAISTKDGPASIVATDTHPFWVTSEHRWVDAGDLTPGMTLRTPDGQTVTIQAIHHHTKQRTTHDLTITGIHAYYVMAGDTPLLVHNVNEGDLCNLTLGPNLKGQKAEGVTAERGDTVLAHEQKMVNRSGDKNGCAGCGAPVSGYKDGHWTGDHNPPNKLAPDGRWTLYPHCKACSRKQGGIVRSLIKEYYDFPAWKPRR